MEISKLVSLSIQCNNCSRGRSVSEEDFKAHLITCSDPECGSQFSIYEGIKNGFKKVEDHIMPNSFLANGMINHLIDVKIGFINVIELPQAVKKVYKVNLIPMGSFLCGVSDISNNKVTIFSSLPDNGDVSTIGNIGKAMALISFKSEDYPMPWLHILQNAMEKLREEDYLTSILMAEIAFETYVELVLSLGYRDNGLDNDSLDRFLRAIDLPIKVNALMNNLYGIKLSNSSSWRDWEKKVLKWRNQIAHGSKTHATKEEAVLAYENVIDSIFYFIEGIDDYWKEKGIQQGMFYQL